MLCQTCAVGNFRSTENNDLRRKQKSGRCRKWLSCFRFQRSGLNYEPGAWVFGSLRARHIKSPLSARFSLPRVIFALLLRLILGQFPGKFQKPHFRSYFYWHNNCFITGVAVRIDDRA